MQISLTRPSDKDRPVRAAWGRGKVAWGGVGLSRVEYHGTDAQASLGRGGPVRAAWGRGKVAWGGVGLSRVEYHGTDAQASLGRVGPVRAAWGRGKVAWGGVGLSRVEYHGTDAEASLGRGGPVRAAWGRGKVAWGGVGLSRFEYHGTDAEASLTSGRRPSGVGGYRPKPPKPGRPHAMRAGEDVQAFSPGLGWTTAPGSTLELDCASIPSRSQLRSFSGLCKLWWLTAPWLQLLATTRVRMGMYGASCAREHQDLPPTSPPNPSIKLNRSGVMLMVMLMSLPLVLLLCLFHVESSTQHSRFRHKTPTSAVHI